MVQMTDVEWWRAFDQCTADKIVEKMKGNDVAMDTTKREVCERKYPAWLISFVLTLRPQA